MTDEDPKISTQDLNQIKALTTKPLTLLGRGLDAWMGRSVSTCIPWPNSNVLLLYRCSTKQKLRNIQVLVLKLKENCQHNTELLFGV